MGRMERRSPLDPGETGAEGWQENYSRLRQKDAYLTGMLFRKFYFLDRANSVGDPDTTFLTVPNIPLLTAFDKIRNYWGFKKSIGRGMILAQGRGTPFINVSFSGLLWG